MADEKQLEILKQGAEAWNAWRAENPDVEVDLSGANLSDAYLREADLIWANLREANLSGANLSRANLVGANLSGANLVGADLSGADLVGADLSGANLSGADLMWVDLVGADLSGADLSGVDLSEADLTGAKVYGASIWKVNLEGATQKDIVITDDGEPKVTVDDLEVAQFIYLLLNNERLRNVLDAVARKVVLILGRFTDERKAVLDRLRDELSRREFSPVMFDFDKQENQDFTETVRTLAHLSRFVIADLTEARSVPQELTATIPDLSSPFLPIINHQQGPWGMFNDFYKYAWVLKEYRYESVDGLVDALDKMLIPKLLEVEQQITQLRQRDDWPSVAECATTNGDENG